MSVLFIRWMEEIRVEQPWTAKQEFYLRFVLLRIGVVVVIVFHKNCENAIKNGINETKIQQQQQ